MKAKKYGGILVGVIGLLVCLALLVSTFTVLKEYTDEMDEQSRLKVSSFTEDMNGILNDRLNEYGRLAEKIAFDITSASKTMSEGDLSVYLRKAISEDPDYADVHAIRFFTDGVEYVSDGYEYGGEGFGYHEDPDVLACVGSETTTCCGCVYDYEQQNTVFGFYVPMEENRHMDALLVLFPVAKLTTVIDEVPTESYEYADFSALCTRHGEIIAFNGKGEEEKNNGFSLHENIIESFQKMTLNTETTMKVDKLIEEGKSETFVTTIGSDKTIVSLCGNTDLGGGLFFFNMFPSNGEYNASFRLANTMLGILAAGIIILLIVTLFFTIRSSLQDKHLEKLSTTDMALDCPTLAGFERDTHDILSRNRSTKFAIVVCDIPYLNYITENFGVDAANEVLKFVRDLLAKAVKTDEMYAFLGESQFVALIHYQKDNDIHVRLHNIYSLAFRYSGLAEKKYNLKLLFGVYEIEREADQKVQNMIDKALVAKNSPAQFRQINYIKFYTQEIKESYIVKADIEARMESALKNDEFKVFFQPKYNINERRPDGAEALVRWYDPDTKAYRLPGKFLPVLEANGFIVSVDHYVYQKVCEYIGQAIVNGQTLYPISVNVSRQTAIEPGFVDFYSRLKRQYKIVDRFITIEITEGVVDETAEDNIETLRSITNGLRQNGFQVSIDDFGTGYSSYNILKQLPVDEIKLDRFFLQKGMSEQRDDAIVESVITVSKSLGFKVTQEGVETVEQVNRLRELGCDVIQGYYYAKPLTTVDYIAFVNDKSHIGQKLGMPNE